MLTEQAKFVGIEGRDEDIGFLSLTEDLSNFRDAIKRYFRRWALIIITSF